MNIQITSRKFKASDSLKEYITSEVNSLTKIYDTIMAVEVILSYTHLKDSIKKVELIYQIPGKTLNVSEETDDFKKSIANAISKAKRQIRKYKSLQIEH
jgi:putative sigma-54 modulation protein